MSLHTFKKSKKYKVKISSRSYIGIVTGCNQWNRKKIRTKTSSTGKVKDRREKNTTIHLIFVPYNVDVP